jgi:hypothetical protein
MTEPEAVTLQAFRSLTAEHGAALQRLARGYELGAIVALYRRSARRIALEIEALGPR